MRMTVLGSGTNVHPTRAAAGYLVETDQLLLFDFGPRTLMNIIKVGVDRHRLRHLFITHHHTDHFADFLPFFFDAVFHAKFVAPRPGLTIYGPRGTRRLFGTLVKVVPGFSTAPFPITITEPGDRTIRIGHTRVTAGTVVHRPRLHCQGYRVAHNGADVVWHLERDRQNGDLDVEVLHRELLEGALGIDPEAVREQRYLGYLRSRSHLASALAGRTN